MDSDAGTLTVILDDATTAHVHRNFRCGLCYCDAHASPHLHAPTCDPYEFTDEDPDADEYDYSESKHADGYALTDG